MPAKTIDSAASSKKLTINTLDLTILSLEYRIPLSRPGTNGRTMYVRIYL
ncbi:hypothetical protein DSUL_80085 [Desulfovibrionales bacterium]